MIRDCVTRLLAVLALAATLFAADAPAFAQGSTYQDGVTFGAGRLNIFQAGSPQDCIAACQQDRRCRAWTYQRVEYNSRGVPVCHLHRYIGERTPHPCCVSGVIRRW
jgi:hypothetical protein